MSATTLLNVREVCNRLDVCRSTLYKGVRNGSIPAPVHVTPTAPRWRSDELGEYIEKLSQSRSRA